ncbi:putative salt-induced outer membrane protein [Altererythrobacter epoxidivorans]|uniref:Putative salt-induced outer membrane protein n=1 Tax=Altererythrobacter epoxidivorans TaxID=361183 RepID=A0A0M3TA29_9SPHN|nr:DUF481 domain-containing protein [Altererythrobacter epoxidivorans]ALE16046.1 putative salt-induced outer membrane protein [Altererythrobacter epoxidivorans]
MKSAFKLAAAFAMLSAPYMAHAELPEPVRAMIDAAIASGDAKKVATVIEIAKLTNPDDAEELSSIQAEFDEQQAVLAAEKAAEKKEAIRNAGLFENWHGKGELGAFRSTGNSSNTGLAAGLELKRVGIDWRHKLTGRVDYQRSNGTTTREQFFVGYEPNYRISERFFAYALAQYERDEFQGFSGRYAVSGGIGYQIIERPDVTLSAKAGPAYRVTDYVDGTSESSLAGLLGVDFDWSITDRLKLTHDTNAVAETGGAATVIVDANNTSIDLVTGLNAKISDKLSTRFSYAVEHDTNPPAGSVKTDTLSRVTVIYDF